MQRYELVATAVVLDRADTKVITVFSFVGRNSDLSKSPTSHTSRDRRDLTVRCLTQLVKKEPIDAAINAQHYHSLGISQKISS